MSDPGSSEDSRATSSDEEKSNGCVGNADAFLYSHLGKRLSLPRSKKDRYFFWSVLLLILAVNVGNLVWSIVKLSSRRPALEDDGLMDLSVYPKVTVVVCPAYDFRWVESDCDLGVGWWTWLSMVSTTKQRTARVEYMDGHPHASVTDLSDLQRLQEALDENLILKEDFRIDAPQHHGPFSQYVYPKGWRLRLCEECTNWTKTSLLRDMDLSGLSRGVRVNFTIGPDTQRFTRKATVAQSEVLCLFQPLPPISRSDEVAQFFDLTITHRPQKGQCKFDKVFMAFVDSEKEITERSWFQSVSSVQVWDGKQIYAGLAAKSIENVAGESSFHFTVTSTHVEEHAWCNKSHGEKLCLYLGNTNLNWHVSRVKESYTYTSQSFLDQLVSVFNFAMAMLGILFPMKVYLTGDANLPLSESRRGLVPVPARKPDCLSPSPHIPQRYSMQENSP